MSVPVCVARSITGLPVLFSAQSARVVNLTMFTKQIGVRRVLPSHADSSCGGEKVGGKMLRWFAAIGYRPPESVRLPASFHMSPLEALVD